MIKKKNCYCFLAPNANETILEKKCGEQRYLEETQVQV